MNQKLVVNVIGFPACGKSSVCKHLAERGFFVQRPSDVIRAFAAKHNMVLTAREDYIAAHLALNQENPIAIIEPVLQSSETRICLDGLRSPFLLDRLLQEPFKTVTIALDCPVEIRYQRMRDDDARKGTHRAPATFEAFIADEQADYYNPDPNVANMGTMMKRADYTIDASKDAETVQRAVDEIVDTIIAVQ